MTDEQRLHDRATRGEVLSIAEQRELDRWYEAQDAAEARLLEGVGSHDARSSIKAEIGDLLTRITETTSHIRTLTTENDDLRRQISDLRSRLGRRAFA